VAEFFQLGRHLFGDLVASGLVGQPLLDLLLTVSQRPIGQRDSEFVLE
jgi:hypothetical protein